VKNTTARKVSVLVPGLSSKELKPTEDSLVAEEKSLNETLQPLNQNAIAQNKALVTRVNNFRKRAAEYERTRKVRAAELELTRRDAWQKFFVALEPVLKDVIAESKADVVLDRSATVHTSDGVDKTALVISKLDAATPTISVSKQSLPKQGSK